MAMLGDVKQPKPDGLAHGAARIGYAILELFHATGDAKYRPAAEAAFGRARGIGTQEHRYGRALFASLRRLPI